MAASLITDKLKRNQVMIYGLAYAYTTLLLKPYLHAFDFIAVVEVMALLLHGLSRFLPSKARYDQLTPRGMANSQSLCVVTVFGQMGRLHWENSRFISKRMPRGLLYYSSV